MTFKAPIFTELNTSSQSADELRLMIEGLMGRNVSAVCMNGTLGTSALAVSQSGTPAMNIKIEGGGAFIKGDTSNQGWYHVFNDAYVTKTVSAAHASLARKDRVILQVRDESYNGAYTNDADVIVVTGTPNASPSEPSLAAYRDYIELALIDVPAAATTIIDSYITDRRPRFAAQGGLVPCTSSTRPSSPYEGMTIYETNTDRVPFYDGTSWRFKGTNVMSRTSRTSGDKTLNNSGSWANVDTTTDITLPAVAGDWVEVNISGHLGAEAVAVRFDAKFNNSGNQFGSSDVTGGWPGWYVGNSSDKDSVSGSAFAQVQSGDISGGNVVIRIIYNTGTATNRALNATSAIPFYVTAKNHGPS